MLPKKRSPLSNQKGQILVEYLLLMVIAIACAAVLTNKLISRGPDVNNAGIIITQWHKIIKIIGNDLPDCANQTNFQDAKCP